MVGDGNVVNTTFVELAQLLDEISAYVADNPGLTDQEKLDAYADLQSLQSQLQKPSPSREIVRCLWHNISELAKVSGLADAVEKASSLIGPLLV